MPKNQKISIDPILVQLVRDFFHEEWLVCSRKASDPAEAILWHALANTAESVSLETASFGEVDPEQLSPEEKIELLLTEVLLNVHTQLAVLRSLREDPSSPDNRDVIIPLQQLLAALPRLVDTIIPKYNAFLVSRLHLQEKSRLYIRSLVARKYLECGGLPAAATAPSRDSVISFLEHELGASLFAGKREEIDLFLDLIQAAKKSSFNPDEPLERFFSRLHSRFIKTLIGLQRLWSIAIGVSLS